MNSGTFTALAAGDLSSAGMMTSHKALTVLRWSSLKVNGQKSPGFQDFIRFGSVPYPPGTGTPVDTDGAPKVCSLRSATVPAAAATHLRASRRLRCGVESEFIVGK